MDCSTSIRYTEGSSLYTPATLTSTACATNCQRLYPASLQSATISALNASLAYAPLSPRPFSLLSLVQKTPLTSSHMLLSFVYYENTFWCSGCWYQQATSSPRELLKHLRCYSSLCERWVLCIFDELYSELECLTNSLECWCRRPLLRGAHPRLSLSRLSNIFKITRRWCCYFISFYMN